MFYKGGGGGREAGGGGGEGGCPTLPRLQRTHAAGTQGKGKKKHASRISLYQTVTAITTDNQQNRARTVLHYITR